MVSHSTVLSMPPPQQVTQSRAPIYRKVFPYLFLVLNQMSGELGNRHSAVQPFPSDGQRSTCLKADWRWAKHGARWRQSVHEAARALEAPATSPQDTATQMCPQNSVPRYCGCWELTGGREPTAKAGATGTGAEPCGLSPSMPTLPTLLQSSCCHRALCSLFPKLSNKINFLGGE